MGFRSFYFVSRLYVRNYGSALMSRHRISITRIVFVTQQRRFGRFSATDLLPVQILIKVKFYQLVLDKKFELRFRSRTRDRRPIFKRRKLTNFIKILMVQTNTDLTYNKKQEDQTSEIYLIYTGTKHTRTSLKSSNSQDDKSDEKFIYLIWLSFQILV